MSLLLDDAVEEEIVQLPDRYEVIDGEVVEMLPMSADANGLSAELSRRLANHGDAKNIGLAFPEILIQLPLPADRRRRPDVIFVTKLGEYFAAGVRQVWIVYPTQEQVHVHVYESISKMKILTQADVLDGGDIVPGFRLLLADLFMHDE